MFWLDEIRDASLHDEGHAPRSDESTDRGGSGSSIGWTFRYDVQIVGCKGCVLWNLPGLLELKFGWHLEDQTNYCPTSWFKVEGEEEKSSVGDESQEVVNPGGEHGE